LPEIVGSVRSATMGRPALHMTPTQVRLPKVVRDRITDLVGKKGMAAFIREAIEEKLAATEARPSRKPSSARERNKPKPD
jgi:Arc/MetJ-type ribon-helix-helix transcriptional regulator